MLLIPQTIDNYGMLYLPIVFKIKRVMNKIVKWILIVIAVIAVLLFFGYRYMLSETKKHSPEQNLEYKIQDMELKLYYSQPSKKGRDIFGALVPFGEVWRTGANEPSTFATNKTISFGGVQVPAGTYSLWTIPGERKWTVILNNGKYDWGVSMQGVASRIADNDVASVVVPVQELNQEVEKLTIEINENPTRLDIAWDKTSVSVPIN
jgi:hypothetical protein